MIPLALLGVGPHARRVYLPALQRLHEQGRVQLPIVVELAERRDETYRHLAAFGFTSVDVLVAPGGASTGHLDARFAAGLAGAVERAGVTGVILATEPVVHLDYLRWAAASGLHVLTDKPIITFDGIANDPSLGAAVLCSFEELLTATEASGTYVAVNAQRRFHPGFDYVLGAVTEAATRFECPITSIQSLHCDGQWRLPPEIKRQRYHPYNTGYGKLSHSSYHILDIQALLVETGARLAGLAYDEVKSYTQCVRPDGLLAQVPRRTYASHFGPDWDDYCPETDDELAEQFRTYGEVDVAVNTSFLRRGIRVLLSQATLLHNGFARRDWMMPGADLYKGNGRVKHEYHNIEQGPFQCVQVHSYQTSDDHDTTTADDLEWGGNNHFDVYVYRNAKMWDGEPVMQKVTAVDLVGSSEMTDDALLSEQTKHRVVNEFVAVLEDRLDPRNTRSPLRSHRLTNTLLSVAYQSLARDEPVAASIHWAP